MSAFTHDLIIVGTGPAGLTAALYGQRAGLNTVVLGDIPGGNTYMIESIDNMPGFLGGIPGTQFGVQALQQAQAEGALFPLARMEALEQVEGAFGGRDVNGQDYRAPAAVIASGRVPKRLAVAKANLKGVHFCSICDGPLYRGKAARLAVVGSDNAAAQHAIALARIAPQVLLIFRSSEPLMDPAHRKLIDGLANVELHPRTEVKGYNGLDFLETLEVVGDGTPANEIAVDGLFLAIGWRPNTALLKIPVATTRAGYIRTDASLMTSCAGLFAAGDVRDTDLGQVLTACADGARAAQHAAAFIGQLR